MTSTDAKPRRMRPKFDAATAELRRDHRRSDTVIAAAIGVSEATVRLARSALYADGSLPRRIGPRTAALRADPELHTAQPSVLARRHGLPVSWASEVQQMAWGAERRKRRHQR